MHIITTKDKYGKFRKLISSNCVVCCKEFLLRKDFINRRDCCSKSCSSIKRKKRQLIQCDYCSVSFEKPLNKINKSKTKLNFCTRKCKDTAQRIEGLLELHLSHYHTKNPNAIPSYRKMALRTHKPICNKCHYKDDVRMLDVHHIDGSRKNNNLNNLEVLCVWCHALETRKNWNTKVF